MRDHAVNGLIPEVAQKQESGFGRGLGVQVLPSGPSDPFAFKTITSNEDPGPEKAPIRFCDEHWSKMCAAMPDETTVMRAFEVLVRLSLKSIGSKGVTTHRCPVCAFKQFDFITEVAEAMKPQENKPKIMVV